jgi:hypothetical protein
MRDRKRSRIVLIAGLGALVLFQYQNCAPSEALRTGYSESVDGSVRVIEDWDLDKIAFVDTSVEIQAGTQTLLIEGVCSRRETEQLDWLLQSPQHEGLQRGFVSCEGGGFSLKLLEVSELLCGVGYTLEISDENGLGASLSLSKRCQPLSSKPAADKGGLSGRGCYLEKTANPEGIECQRVCYAEGRVYFREDESGELCNAIVSKNLQSGTKPEQDESL